MDSYTIKTNKVARLLKYRYEVPQKVLDNQFDWLDEDETSGFICYKKEWFHLSEFMRLDNFSDFSKAGYDGYCGDSYFSGTLIKIIDDESVIMARYYS